jgi:segregation and condensation protein A
MSVDEPFEADLPPATEGPLVVDLEGYEGPLDVLLTLARTQKVDLTRISILRLAEQYLDFIREARQLRLEIAADYLVMAAWLAYLKSRLLLPDVPDDDELTGPEMAARLAFQLRRLEAMREAATRLMARDRLGREVFARGAPEGIRVIQSSVFEASLYDLLKAYGDHRTRLAPSHLRITPAVVYTVDAALERLREMLGAIPDWQTLERFLPTDLAEGVSQRSAVAATFVASLELVRQGQIELRQGSDFGPLYIRRAKPKAKPPE